MGWGPSPGDITAEELMVAEGLLELEGAPWRIGWGAKQKRSKMISRGDSNYEDNVGMGAPNGKAGSPRSPLSWIATERDRSDSTTQVAFPPRDRPLGPTPDSKVGRGHRAHKRSCRRVPRKKSHAELKDLENGLLLEREDLEKGIQQILKAYQGLRDENELLKVQVPLCSGRREEAELPCTSPAISSHLAKETEAPGMLNFTLRFVKCELTENLSATLPFAPFSDETLSAGRSLPAHQLNSLDKSEMGGSSMPAHQLKSLDKSEMGGSSMHADALSCGFRLPDLNVPVEDLSDNCEDVFDDQVSLVHKKAAVATDSGKYINELIRVEYFNA